MKVQPSTALETQKARELALSGLHNFRRTLSTPPPPIRPKSAPVNGAHRRPAIFTDYPRIAVHAHSESPLGHWPRQLHACPTTRGLTRSSAEGVRADGARTVYTSAIDNLTEGRLFVTPNAAPSRLWSVQFRSLSDQSLQEPVELLDQISSLRPDRKADSASRTQ
jgi:hypothetical protein